MCRRKPEQNNRQKLTISEKFLRWWDICGRKQEAPVKHQPAIFVERAMETAKVWSLQLFCDWDLNLIIPGCKLGALQLCWLISAWCCVAPCLCSPLVLVWWNLHDILCFDLFNFMLNLPLFLMYKYFLLLCRVKKQCNDMNYLCCSHS